MSFTRIGILGLSFIALAALPVMADQYVFTSDHCTGNCSTGAANMGTIGVVQDGTGIVKITVSLESGFGFVDTGAGGGGSFFFNIQAISGGNADNPTVTISNLTSGWSLPGGGTTEAGLAGNGTTGYAGDGFGKDFEYELICAGNVGGCGSGGSSPKPPPLSFDITASGGLTPASFADPGGGGAFFVADVISTNITPPNTTGNTGLIDSSGAATCTDAFPCAPPPSVPEPSSVLLLGTAGFGILLSLKRRFGNAKAS